MGRIVTCGICGFQFERGEPEQEAKHLVLHLQQDQSELELPGTVRDLIRYWADQKLRAASEDMTPKELQEVDTAKWVMMHMWYNGSGHTTQDRDETFKQYEADIRKMYPNLRNLPSNFVGAGSYDTTERDIIKIC